MRLLFVSNMPAPHQLELFRAVAGVPGVSLRALFCAWSAPGRAWSRPELPSGFEVLPHVSFEETVPGLVFTRGMARRILDFRPDVAIVGGHAIPGLHRAMAVLSTHGVPWLFWEEFHPLPERPARWRTAVRKRLLFSALERCTAVLGIGQRAVAYFTALTGEAKPVHNFPYGSDLARFTREAPATQPQGPRFLYAGRLVEAKGVELLVRAFARIAERHPSAELVLVGDGPLRSRLEASIPPAIRGRVDFRGHRQWDELPREYARGNVLVFPSRHDGWGMVIPEAMAVGLPIIATRQTGAAHGRAGARGMSNARRAPGWTTAGGDRCGVRAKVGGKKKVAPAGVPAEGMTVTHVLDNRPGTGGRRGGMPIALALLLAVAGLTPALAAPTPAQRCAAAKLKAAAKKATGKIRCHEKAILKGLGVDALCLQKAESKFATAFAKAELKGGCATVGDAAAIELLVDDFVEQAVDALEPPVSFAAVVQPIFSARCAVSGCHVAPAPAAGLDLSAGVAYANIVNVDSSQVPTSKRVFPGDAAVSYLYQKITNDPGIVGSPMPLGAFPMPAGEIDAIERWIAEGAANN